MSRPVKSVLNTLSQEQERSSVLVRRATSGTTTTASPALQALLAVRVVLFVSAVQVEVTRYTVRLPVAVQQDCTGTLPTVPAALKTRTAQRTLLPAPPAPRILCPSLVQLTVTTVHRDMCGRTTPA